MKIIAFLFCILFTINISQEVPDRDSYHNTNSEVFWGDRKIEGVDVETFFIINEYSYAKDKNNVYYEGKQIKGADPETFKILWDEWSRDKNNVYFYRNKIDYGMIAFKYSFGLNTYAEDYMNMFK